MKTDVIIVGGGLFGSMTALHLQKKGMDVLVIDSAHPMAASKCSFGVWKDGWVNEVIRAEVDYGMPLLERYTEVKDVEFFNTKKGVVEIFRKADCSTLLNAAVPRKEGEVTALGKRFVSVNGEVIQAKRAVVVAAGVWTPQVLSLCAGIDHLPSVDMIWGATLDVRIKLEENRIQEWAPYRQSVMVQEEGYFRFGDGATVKNPKGVADPRLDKASTRLIQHLNDIVGVTVNPDKITAVHEGYRPYMKKGTPSLVNKHFDWLFSATGGAKNSTILCGYVAREIHSHIQG